MDELTGLQWLLMVGGLVVLVVLYRKRDKVKSVLGIRSSGGSGSGSKTQKK